MEDRVLRSISRPLLFNRTGMTADRSRPDQQLPQRAARGAASMKPAFQSYSEISVLARDL